MCRTFLVQEVDVGAAVPGLPLGGVHLEVVPEHLVQVARLQAGVGSQLQLVDPVLGGVHVESFSTHRGEDVSRSRVGECSSDHVTVKPVLFSRGSWSTIKFN